MEGDYVFKPSGVINTVELPRRNEENTSLDMKPALSLNKDTITRMRARSEGGEIWWRMRGDKHLLRGLSLLWPTGLKSRANCVWKGDDTHRNVNGAEYFRGGIIAWQREDGWVSPKAFSGWVPPFCYCKPGVKDDSNVRLTRASCPSVHPSLTRCKLATYNREHFWLHLTLDQSSHRVQLQKKKPFFSFLSLNWININLRMFGFGKRNYHQAEIHSKAINTGNSYSLWLFYSICHFEISTSAAHMVNPVTIAVWHKWFLSLF